MKLFPPSFIALLVAVLLVGIVFIWQHSNAHASFGTEQAVALIVAAVLFLYAVASWLAGEVRRMK